MKNIILFDNEVRDRLLPLTFTRPVCEIRMGILTIREKWEKWLNGEASYITQDYLSGKFPIKITEENYVINGSLLPSDQMCRLIEQMESNEALLKGGELLATKLNQKQFERLMKDEEIQELLGFDVEDTDYYKINNVWDIFRLNDQAIRDDFRLLTKDRESQPLSDTNRVIGAENIFLEEGASVECATLNASKGPIYIGKNAEIMEGAVVRGSLALCEGAKIKMSAKFYSGNTIGPYSKVGGEVNNSVLIGYSNKSHDGYLGNSIIGEWCNLGADSNISNLKNNYSEVKLWNYMSERFERTGQQFLGLVMGDHSKCAINTMFNSGTVVGVSSNVFGAGFPRNFVPSFSWGGAGGYKTYKIDKALETAELVMKRRNKKLEETEASILRRVAEDTQKYRSWEKVEAI
ncbi:MAG: GlmU family protein [Bacteroidota bacterium]